MTIKRYLSDPALTGHVTVTEILEGERPAVRLAETWFHPQGGGQKADRGWIGGAEVVHVSHAQDDVDHHVSGLADLAVGGVYPFRIDREARAVNAAYHTAGHLIGSLVEARSALRAVAGHQWPGEARVEFEGEIEDPAVLQAQLERDLDRALADDLPVAPELDELGRRAVRIGQFAPIPCGGTHVDRLGRVGAVHIDAVKRKGGRLRVSYSVATEATR